MFTANRRPIAILVYHQISEPPSTGSPYRDLHVTPLNFERQISLLARLGYTGHSMSGLEPYLSGEKHGKVVGITFDDGYLNNLSNAMPILNFYGFSSTCYVVSSLIGRTNLWDAGIGVPEAGLMDTIQLQAWVRGGQEVGSHTQNHINLLHRDDELCRFEIASARAELEAAIEQRVKHFAYPYGAYGARHAAMARECGYVTATTTRQARCNTRVDMLQLPRISVLRTTSQGMLWVNVATAYTDALDSVRSAARRGRAMILDQKPFGSASAGDS